MKLKILNICQIDRHKRALIHHHANMDMVDAINELYQVQKDFNKLKEIFKSEIERCEYCGEYKRVGFSCDCKQRDVKQKEAE